MSQTEMIFIIILHNSKDQTVKLAYMLLKMPYKFNIQEKLHTGMHSSEHQNEAFEIQSKAINRIKLGNLLRQLLHLHWVQDIQAGQEYGLSCVAEYSEMLIRKWL